MPTPPACRRAHTAPVRKPPPCPSPEGEREHRGWLWVGAGIVALGLYGFVATFQPDAHFGRILAAYGGIFVAGSLLWGAVADGYRPDRFDITGTLVCLTGMAVIMYAPRGH
ncbi:YnfA family protein [Parafrankia elaeagni]|uniref:YnfA family protein n=1 Tax=Parafrankia elaeagni TaxID=222534 RepID=UPI000362F518|nr:YnfA family protein [Parafrankia elaeagni]